MASDLSSYLLDCDDFTNRRRSPQRYQWIWGYVMLSLIAVKRLFSLGQVVLTPSVEELRVNNKIDVNGLIARHVSGDWSDMCEGDQVENKHAVACGDRVFSSFKLNVSQDIWIITEHDRSYTTILLPQEY